MEVGKKRDVQSEKAEKQQKIELVVKVDRALYETLKRKVLRVVGDEGLAEEIVKYHASVGANTGIISVLLEFKKIGEAYSLAMEGEAEEENKADDEKQGPGVLVIPGTPIVMPPIPPQGNLSLPDLDDSDVR